MRPGYDAHGCMELSVLSRCAMGGRATLEGPGTAYSVEDSVGRRASNVEDIGGVGGACLISGLPRDVGIPEVIAVGHWLARCWVWWWSSLWDGGGKGGGWWW